MPRIIPIRDLRDTGKISELCHASEEPIYVTKNGYDDMVIMSMKTYEKKMFMADVYQKLNAAEEQVADSQVLDADTSLKSIREKYDV